MRERERRKSHSESTYEAPSLAGSAKSCNPKCVEWPQNVEGGSAQEVRGPELTTGGPQERNTNRHARRRSSRCGFTHFLSHSSGASLPRSRVERTENNRSDPPPRALRAPPTPSEPSGQVAFSRPSPEIPPGAEGSFPSRDRTLRALPGGPPRKGSRAATSHASPPPPRHASPRRGPPAPPGAPRPDAPCAPVPGCSSPTPVQ